MRKEVYIVWLEDAPNSMAHKERVLCVESILSEKGYLGKITQTKTFDEAEKILMSNKRVDFFITDFNISDEKHDGLSYLKTIRAQNAYKQFVILYSNNEHHIIKESVKKVLDMEQIEVFSNFTFFSLNDEMDEVHLKKAIDIILCRWDELNAIRGRFMCENAELEYKLREKLNCLDDENITYNKMIHQFFRDKVHVSSRKKFEKLKNEWIQLSKKRNMLAHVEEKYDPVKGYYIESILKDEGETLKIFESKLDIERTELISLKQRLLDFLKNPY